jgi:hypothetical protein
MKKALMAGAAALVLSVAVMGNAEACLVKDPSLNVRNAPDGLVTGSLKKGTLVVIEERRGDWVSITPHAKRSETPVWVRYSDLDCDFVDDEYRKAEREGKTPKQFAEEVLRQTKPVRRTDQQLRNAAFTTASTIALGQWCKVPLTYGEQVEAIVVGVQVGHDRLVMALEELDKGRTKLGASEFCLRLEKSIRGKVEW